MLPSTGENLEYRKTNEGVKFGHAGGGLQDVLEQSNQKGAFEICCPALKSVVLP